MQQSSLVLQMSSLLWVEEGANHSVCSVYHNALIAEHHPAAKMRLSARPDVKFVLHEWLGVHRRFH